MKVIFNSALATAILLFGINASQAGVVIGGTRVIYDGSKKEASLSVNNPDSVPYLIQSWLENPAGGAEKVPFIITPPLYRLDQGQKNIMRIVRAGNVPADKESMYWLNIKSIPSTEKRANTLQIALKTRIKLIYRPEALKEHAPEDLADKLSWQQVGNQLQVSNPTAYYMNFNEITVNGKKLPEVSYVAPGQSNRFALPDNASGHTLEFKLISDFGGTGASHHATY